MVSLKTGDPCPCCGQPIPLKDPDALRLLSLLSDIMGFPRKVDARHSNESSTEPCGLLLQSRTAALKGEQDGTSDI